MSKPVSFKEIVLVAIVFVAATYLIWSVLEPWLRVDIWLNNDNRNYHPDMIAYGMQRLIHGEFPLWNPYQAAGVPFFAALQGMVLYPPTWLALVFSAETTHVVGKFIHLVFSGLSIYFFLRIIKLHPLASFLAGLFFMTGNFYLVFIVFETAAYPLATVGFLLGAIEKIIQTRSRPADCYANRWSLFFVVVLTLQVFAGYIQSVVFIGYFLCLYIPFRIGQRYLVDRNMQVVCAQLVRFGAMAIITLILSAVQLLPTFEMSTLSSTHNLQEGMDLSQVNLSFLTPLSYGDTLSDPVVPIAKTHWDSIFWFFVLIGLVLSGQLRAFTVFFVMTTLLFLTMARGTETSLYELYYYYFPTGSFFRWPEKFLLMSNMTISILVGVGLHHFCRLISHYSGRSAEFAFWFYCFVIFSTAFITRYSSFELEIEQPDWHWKSFGKQHSPYQFTNVLDGMQYAADNPPMFRIYTKDPYQKAEQAFSYLRDNSGYERIISLLNLGWILVPDLPVKWGMREQLYSIEDYEPLISARYEGYMKQMGANAFPHISLPQNDEMVSLFGARWLLVSQNWLKRKRRKNLPEGLRVAYSDEHFVVYEIPSVVPRSYIISNVVSIPEEKILHYLSSGSFDPFTEVIVNDSVVLESVPQKDQLYSATIVEYEPEKVVIELPSHGAKGVLVLTDSYGPNWRATIDGREAEVFPVNHLYRGVEVSSQDRQVVFFYHPVFVYWGGVISVFGIILVVVFLFSVRQRSSSLNP